MANSKLTAIILGAALGSSMITVAAAAHASSVHHRSVAVHRRPVHRHRPQAVSSASHLVSHAFVAYGTGFAGSASTFSFESHWPLITVYAPWGFALTAAGQMVERGGGAVAPVIKFAHAHGRMVMPLFTNAFGNEAVLLNSSTRAAALSHIVAAVRHYSLDGAVVDFEGLGPTATAPLTDFVTRLAALLHPLGKAVMVAVGPEWAGENPQWAVYDYAGLGQAADRVLLMTYDEHSNPGGPGPVAGLPWVTGSLQYALSEIPANKIMLGLADYGYDWSPGQANTVTAAQAYALASRQGVKLQWSAATAEPLFTYTAGAASHAVWFEDGKSVGQRVHLADMADIGGLALWQLGGEGPNFWPQIAAYHPAP